MLGIEVHILDVQIDQFLQPDTGAEEQLDDDPVPRRQHGGPAAKLLEQPPFLSFRQKARGVAWKPTQPQ